MKIRIIITQIGENTGANENAENNQDENISAENKETVSVLVAGEKIYITPLINSLVIETLGEEKKLEVISEINGWTYIKIGETSGWVRNEKIQKKEVENNTSNPEDNNSNKTSSPKIGYISGTSVNFRKTPNTSGEVITKLKRNAKVTVIKKENDWIQIEYNGNTGYVASDYISDKELETTSRSSVDRTAKASKVEETQKNKDMSSNEKINVSGTVTGSDVVSYAKQYLGYKYVSGGASPSKGFDCSGFTTYVFKHFGISLSRTSSGQSSNGVSVSKSELTAGDIICFSSSSKSKKIGHVGIYIGGGKFIHSANSRKGVIISNVSGDGYYFVVARRVI